MRTDRQARLTRPARLQGRRTSRNPLIADRPAPQWVEIPVPALVSEETFQLAARRLADNQRFAARNTKIPSLLQGLAACEGCGYDYYRYEGGRVCATFRCVPTTSTGSSGTT